MERIGDALRNAGVAVIYLVHGNLVGADAFGLLPELSRVFPSTSGAVRRVIRRIVDRLNGDLGNFTGNYAKLFEASINRPGGSRIAVRRFHWSSENHHLGRADGAIRLIDELASLELVPSQRVMLWGHSHAGNVFALMTNLLGGSREAVEGFFEATRIYYRWPLLGCVDIPVWGRVRQLLQDPHAPIRQLPLDLVTFGTPIRYGWESAGYARLLHFVYHRPVQGMPEYRAPFPPNLKRVLRGAGGDYVQQLGIAGTDIRPSRLAWRARLAEKRLRTAAAIADAPTQSLGSLQGRSDRPGRRHHLAGRLWPDGRGSGHAPCRPCRLHPHPMAALPRRRGGAAMLPRPA